MKQADPFVLTLNGGSSSIKFALYEMGNPLRRILDGKIDRIGLNGTNLIVNKSTGQPQDNLSLDVKNYGTTVDFLLEWLAALPMFTSEGEALQIELIPFVLPT